MRTFSLFSILVNLIINIFLTISSCLSWVLINNGYWTFIFWLTFPRISESTSCWQLFFFFFFHIATAWTQICYKHWHYHCGDSYYGIELIITTEPKRQWLLQGKGFPWSDLIIAMCIIYFLCTAMTITNQKINRDSFISWGWHWGLVNEFFFFFKKSSQATCRWGVQLEAIKNGIMIKLFQCF